jgi:hypothetical protein
MRKLLQSISRYRLGICLWCGLSILIFLFLQSCGDATIPVTPINNDSVDVVIDTPSVTPKTSLWDSIGPIDNNGFKALYTETVLADGKEWYNISWEHLAGVTFADTYSEAEQAYYYYPTFSAEVLALHKRQVILKGYLIPIEPETGYYVLSANPNSSCFFCGEAGPESVVGVMVDQATDEMVMDAVLTFRGDMVLNREDMYELNYRILNAELVSE